LGKQKYPSDTTVKKKFHIKDLIHFSPLTNNQSIFFDLYNNDPSNHFFLTGSAGTGKTFCAAYLALGDVLSGNYDQLIFVRTAQPIKEIGHLPGDTEEKLAVYEEPYKAMFNNFFKFKNSYDNLKEAAKIHFLSSSFMRGITLDNSVIIIDEVQSMTSHEIMSILTRVGQNSKVIIVGDFKQNDLVYKRYIESGFVRLEKVLKRIPAIKRINFTRDDIVRSEFVKQLIIADEDTPED
jgi:predicted ribonuclease YlaK